MGGKPKQVNAGQAGAANAGATAQAQASASLARTQEQQLKAAMTTLFGAPDQRGGFAPGGGGTLSEFLDPSKLNVDRPTGAFKLQYDQAKKQIGKTFQNQRGALARESANRGFGSGANFTADQERKSRLSEAETQGAAFTDLAGKSYTNALTNFWGATDALTGQANSERAAALQGYGQAGSTYANLYGVSGAQAHPSGAASVLGAGLQAGGTIGAGAMMCTVEGSQITLVDGNKKAVQDLDIGDIVLQRSGFGCKLEDRPMISKQPAVVVETKQFTGKASTSHTYAVPGGGYVYAAAASSYDLETEAGRQTVKDVRSIGEQIVYFVPVKGDHTYCADGLWSLA